MPELMTEITADYGDFRLRGNDGDIVTCDVKPTSL